MKDSNDQAKNHRLLITYFIDLVSNIRYERSINRFGDFRRLKMRPRVIIISSHPFVQSFLISSLSKVEGIEAHLHLGGRIGFPALCEEEADGVFLLDMSSLPFGPDDLYRVLGRGGNKFLALLQSKRFEDEEMLRLLYLGLDGFLKFDESVARQLPKAVDCIRQGTLWAPRRVLTKFIHHAKVLLDLQLQHNLSLTAREHQVFLLLIRRRSNSEIAHALGISERTAKFHASNVLSKLDFPNRGALLTQLEPMVSSTAFLFDSGTAWV